MTEVAKDGFGREMPIGSVVALLNYNRQCVAIYAGKNKNNNHRFYDIGSGTRPEWLKQQIEYYEGAIQKLIDKKKVDLGTCLWSPDTCRAALIQPETLPEKTQELLELLFKFLIMKKIIK